MKLRGYLQLGEPVPATGAAREDRRLVVDQFAAAPGENRGSPSETRPVLFGALGGESSDAAAVWMHAGRIVALTWYVRRRAVGRCRFRRRGKHGWVRGRNHRLERRQFRADKASGKVEQVASVLGEALNSQNPSGRLHSEAVWCML